MSKKASARKSTKAPIGNLKPKARREIGVRGGLQSTLLKSNNDTNNQIIQKIG
jgi:hypothetical protein